MKMKHVLYLTIILGLLLPMSVLADEGDIPMWVQRARLTWTGRSSGGPDAVVGYIHIRDAENDMVEGALVEAVWTVPDTKEPIEPIRIVAVHTNRQGIAIFRQWEGRGEYKLCVTAVTKEDWEYHPELNFDTVKNDTGCQVFVVP